MSRISATARVIAEYVAPESRAAELVEHADLRLEPGPRHSDGAGDRLVEAGDLHSNLLHLEVDIVGAGGAIALELELGVHYHSLRHGHATALLLAGVHPKVAQERLGHHSVAFTLDRYSHTIERLHDDAAAKIDGIFKPS